MVTAQSRVEVHAYGDTLATGQLELTPMLVELEPCSPDSLPVLCPAARRG